MDRHRRSLRGRVRPPRPVVALLYWLSTAALCALDPSLHSLQLLNLAAVVYDLSFELHRLYILVSNRPLLMVGYPQRRARRNGCWSGMRRRTRRTTRNAAG